MILAKIMLAQVALINHIILNGGKILQHTTPQEATKEIEGTIWQKTIERDQLDNNEKLYTILSSNYNQDDTINLRVHASEKPSQDFIAVVPQLDDVYFIALKKDELELV